MSTRTKFGFVIAGVAAVLAMFYYGAIQSRHVEERKLALARAVSVLPPGVDTAWTAYVDRRVASAVQRRGNNVQVAALGDHILGRTNFVSRDTPYSVSCGSVIGAIVWFGAGNDQIMVPIYGPSLVEPGADEVPALGVDSRSIAATRLSEALCERISVRMQEIMAPASASARP